MFLLYFKGSGKTLAFTIPMIHSVLQWHKMKAPPIPSTTGVPPRETRLGAAAHLGSPCGDGTESGVLPEEARIETEAQPSDSGVQATPKTSASASAQALPFCDDDDAGEGPSSLVEEKPVPKQNEDREEKFDAEQAGKLKQELCNQIAVYKVHPRRPLLGLVLTPTRELAIQVRQHIDAVAKFTGEI